MEEQELRNFLRSEGEDLNEVAVPTIDINENLLIDICDLIESDGLDNLIKNLGSIANAFKTENDYSCSTDVLEEAVKVIHAGLVRLHMEITASQGNVKTSLANVERITKHKFRKYLAVLLFLVYKSFMEIERACSAEAHNISIQNAAKDTSRRKKKQVADDLAESQFRFWFHWRPKIIQEIEKLVAPPMDELWEEAPEDVNFMRCITLALCTTVKNKTSRLRVMDEETEDIFDVLGLLAARYQEEKGIMSRLIPLLKGSEETAGMIGNGIHRMIAKISPDLAPKVVVNALAEAFDVYTTNLQKESTAERGFQAFLTQLCSLEPRGAIESLAVIVQFLEFDSHIMRNAVLMVAFDLMNWMWREMHTTENSQEREDRQGDDRPNRRGNWLPLRKKLLDEILLYHMRDTNSLVRSKAINLLAELVRAQTIYPGEATWIMENVRLRLLDKTVTARKNATTLVIDLVKMYPHMVRTKEEFERKIEQKRQEILNIIKHDEANPAIALYFIIKEFHLHQKSDGFTITDSVAEKVTTPDAAMKLLEEFLKEGHYWQACEVLFVSVEKWSEQLEELLHALKKSDDDSNEQIYLRFFKGTHSGVFPEDLDSLELDEINYIAPKRVEDTREFLVYLQCCFSMKSELEECQPALRKLLELGTTTDKKEAVMFYAAICEAGYDPPQAITVSIINALAQLGAEELSDFVGPFRQIFIGRDNLGPAAIVKKLLQLVDKLSEADVENLSGMIGELFRSACLTTESIKVLWDAFSLSTGGWSPNDSRSAAYILGIIGQIERKIVTSNLNQLIDVGLGQRGLDDYELAKVTLQTILFGCRVEPEFLEPEVPKGRSKAAKTANPRNQQTDGIKFPPTHELFPKIVELIEHGLKVEGDDKMDAMYSRVVELSVQIMYRMCTDPREIVMRILPNLCGLVFPPPETQDEFKKSEKLLFRYMSFGKALLGAHINYYEHTVTKEIKQRKAAAAKSKKRPKTNSRQRGSRGESLSSTNNSIMNQSNNDAASEMDLMIGNIGFDSEADSIKTYVAKLLDSGFFRQFRTQVLYLCQVFNTIQSLNLKVACVEALAKIMLVCEQSVIRSIDTLIRLWNGDEPFPVKLEILRASIRLTVRFPNQMEKINDCFSAGLADKNWKVRKACMDYIQYLALSDLLKVREQLSDTAACLCDESYELREMARDFINEISEKDNILQNSIPDIISRLSSREDITQENFQAIMKTLLTKIKKEKQLGGLIERIVGRFKGPVSVRVCQDTAFCLTQVQQNDKTLKILRDNLACYADKLGDELVWDSFMEVLNAIKKLNKPELKMRIDEWEKELEEHRAKCVALDNAEKAAKRKGEKPQRMIESSSDEDEEMEENEGDLAEEGDKNQQEINSSSDKEVDENEGESAEKSAKRKEKKSQRMKESSSDEEMDENGGKSAEKSARNKGKKPQRMKESSSDEEMDENGGKSAEESAKKKGKQPQRVKQPSSDDEVDENGSNHAKKSVKKKGKNSKRVKPPSSDEEMDENGSVEFSSDEEMEENLGVV